MGDKRQQQRIEELEAKLEQASIDYDWLSDLYNPVESETDNDDADRMWDFYDELRADLERMRAMEIELSMLRRSHGTGRGRGRLPDWTPAQLSEARSLKATGASVRAIAREVKVTPSAVQRMLARPDDQPHPQTQVDERLVKRVQELGHYINGARVHMERRARADEQRRKADEHRAKRARKVKGKA